jgi:type VI secretion system protein ImpE
MTVSAKDYYLQGDLTAAISRACDEIREEPNSALKRVFLAELLCFSGDLERADKQLNTLVVLDPQTAITVGIWRRLIRAAQVRCDVYESGSIPEVIDKPTTRIKNALELLLATRDQRSDRIDSILSAIEAVATPQGFNINGQAVSDWRDLDDIHCGILEVMGGNGKYFWIDFEQIVELEFSAPERPLDLLWRKAQLRLTSGTDGEVFIPTTYPSLANDDDQIRLGRKTQWPEVNGVFRGQGLRTWLVGEQDLSIMEIESAIFVDSPIAVDA